MKREYQIVKRDRKGLDATKVPTVLDIAWAAGIYEGEGSCIATGHQKRSFNVQVSQKDPELLYRLRDLFGGGVKPYMNGGFSIHHWTCCGDRGRAFIGAIYPYLTSRRKAQIEATTAWNFLQTIPDLIQYERASEKCHIYAEIWSKIDEFISIQREKAALHTRQRHAIHDKKRAQTPERKAQQKIAIQKHKKMKKEQRLAEATNLVAIA